MLFQIAQGQTELPLAVACQAQRMQRVVNGAFNNQAVPQQCCRRAALRGTQTHGVGVVQCAMHRARTVKTQGYPEQSQLLKLGVSNPVDLQSGGGHQERGG